MYNYFSMHQEGAAINSMYEEYKEVEPDLLAIELLSDTCRNAIMAIKRNGLGNVVTYLKARAHKEDIEAGWRSSGMGIFYGTGAARLALFLVEVIDAPDDSNYSMKDAIRATERLRALQMLSCHATLETNEHGIGGAQGLLFRH